MRDFLDRFFFGNGLMAVAVSSWHSAGHFYDTSDFEYPLDTDVYFGPAMRRSRGNEKKDVLGTCVLWVDADDLARPLATLPPSMVVSSGHGYHLYWVLQDPLEDLELVERLNQTLAADVPTADKGCWNANRILRIPGTRNTKDPPAQVELKTMNRHVYSPEDVMILDRLDRSTKHKVRTGDRRGYRSRSERDWAIVVALVKAGATDELIERIFALQPCGEKYHEQNGVKYLRQTVRKARATKSVVLERGFTEGPDGYLRASSKGDRLVSTFTFQPKLLLDGSQFDIQDAIVGRVVASGYSWDDVTFTRSAFNSVSKLDRETPIAAWQWLGRDDDIRALLPYLLEQLQKAGFPRVAATTTLGLHRIKDTMYFLGTKHLLSAERYWNGFEGPLAWLPSKKEHPEMYLAPECTRAELELLGELVPKLNEPGALWPMLGWYAATPFKPWFESKGLRFPIMNVVGTKGAGKTTLIQRVFMPLFGQVNPKSYDAGTTRFVTLALLGSSNAVPIAFSEFRYDTVERFIRYILLAYDTGHDPRGRGDQTTVDYPLSAPFSIDGEDLVEDPAAKERIVVPRLHPSVVRERGEAYEAYAELRQKIPTTFGGYYIKEGLKCIKDGAFDELLNDSRDALFEAFPSALPDRVRSNHIVAYMGVLFWCRVVGIDSPAPEVMRRSIEAVFDIEAGRARTMVDSMIEDVANACNAGTQGFQWKYEEENHVLWIQLSSSHSWWLASRRRQGRSALERDAIKTQLREAPYGRAPKVIRDTWMFGISLPEAQDLGLDVPSALRVKEVTFKFKGKEG